MAGESNLDSSLLDSCIFCSIASEQDKEAKILAKTDEILCFRDIDPAAPHHYLVIPREHIHSCLSLQRKHINLIKKMAEMGKRVLQTQGVTDMNDISLGFHKPPFISVNHLHLHVIAPSSQICDFMIYKFIPGTESFILQEKDLRKRLEKSEKQQNAKSLNCFSW
ncbi:histidine triad nucleotide-binding protein 3-like isoform X1 [Cynoglossus semilaevis]|uniref:histidine triad nucleotide-binding protein 3-like isoform X1 n=1 Tax=Cynoglossus semilaevis TaxID=244447 RepID=UPI000D62AF00|nr:histidine triad nucleotide-binding protein 3-like isoform X1 [Cynoglossus semilaevis]